MGLRITSLLLGLTWLMVSYATATSREIPMKPSAAAASGYNVNDLSARLATSGGMIECWDALLEMKSCSNEIILFFLNGQADLGAECCGAIGIITHNCWPAMLSSLGFTAEEGNILEGYCDTTDSPSSSPAASPPLPAGAQPNSTAMALD